MCVDVVSFVTDPIRFYGYVIWTKLLLRLTMVRPNSSWTLVLRAECLHYE